MAIKNEIELAYNLLDELSMLDNELKFNNKLYDEVKVQVDNEFDRDRRKEAGTMDVRSSGRRFSVQLVTSLNAQLVSIRSNILSIIKEKSSIKFKLNDQMLKIQQMNNPDSEADNTASIIRDLTIQLGKMNNPSSIENIGVDLEEKKKHQEEIVKRNEEEADDDIVILDDISDDIFDIAVAKDADEESDSNETLKEKFDIAISSLKKEIGLELYYGIGDDSSEPDIGIIPFANGEQLDFEDLGYSPESQAIINYVNHVKSSIVIDGENAVDKFENKYKIVKLIG